MISWFEEQVDTATTIAEPVGGYKQLLQFLEEKINGGDTLGKKSSIPLLVIGFIITRNGDVEKAYIKTPHMACPIHDMIVQELLKTKWLPAKERGERVPYEGDLWGDIRVTKKAQKKFKCRWSS